MSSATRHTHALEMMKKEKYDLLVLSPGPGRPEDFGISKFIDAALQKEMPVFGVCLGVQAIGEYFGGKLGTAGSARPWPAFARSGARWHVDGQSPE